MLEREETDPLVLARGQEAEGYSEKDLRFARRVGLPYRPYLFHSEQERTRESEE